MKKNEIHSAPRYLYLVFTMLPAPLFADTTGSTRIAGTDRVQNCALKFVTPVGILRILSFGTCRQSNLVDALAAAPWQARMMLRFS
jgi:hypothetical protein